MGVQRSDLPRHARRRTIPRSARPNSRLNTHHAFAPAELRPASIDHSIVSGSCRLAQLFLGNVKKRDCQGPGGRRNSNLVIDVEGRGWFGRAVIDPQGIFFAHGLYGGSALGETQVL